MFDYINQWFRTLPEKLRQLPPLQRFAVLGLPAVLLAVLSNLLWPRGVDTHARQRLGSARLRLRVATIATAAIGTALAVGAGGFVFYNTNVRNEYRDDDAREELRP